MRSRSNFIYLAIAVVICVFVSGTAAQKPETTPAPKVKVSPTPTPTPTPSPTPKTTQTPVSPDNGGQVKTFEVRLPVTVTQKKLLISGLKRGDFQVFEDGVPQEVTFFTDEKTNPPVFVGVLMDTSPSAAGKLAFSKEDSFSRP